LLFCCTVNYYISVVDDVWLQATINIVFDRVGRVDPVTRGLEIAVDYLGIQFDVGDIRRYLTHPY